MQFKTVLLVLKLCGPIYVYAQKSIFQQQYRANTSLFKTDQKHSTYHQRTQSNKKAVISC